MTTLPQKDAAGLPTPATRFWRALAALSLRRPWLLAALGLLAFAVALPFAVRLYGDLRTDLRELLPRGAPSAIALDALEKRVGGLGQLTVVVETQDLKAGERFVDALGPRLRQLPRSLQQGVYWKIDDERTYFNAHGALYAEADDLARVRDSLRDNLDRAKKQANPLAVNLLDDDETQAAPGGEKAAAEDPLLKSAFSRVKDAFGRLDHFVDGYLAGDGGHTLVLNVHPPTAGASLEFNQELFGAVDAEVKKLDPKSFHPSLVIGYSGEVRSVIEAQEALVRDLVLSSVLVLLAVGAALFIFYRSLWAIPLLVGPLVTGTALTFAISRGVIHYLNPNTAFLGSIIVGNGINAGIILLARYLEERRAGHSIHEALPTALRSTWLATFAASAAAAASYGSLGAVRFRGFNQFAFMGTVGMVLCWLATYLLMPSWIAIVERLRPLVPAAIRGGNAPRSGVAASFARAIVGWPKLAVAVSLGISLASAGLIVRFSREPLEYDFSKLGSRVGEKAGVGFWGKKVDLVMQSYQTPTVVLTQTAEKAAQVAAALEETRRREGKKSTIDTIATLQRLLPADQPRKLALLREIFSLLTPRVVAHLPADVRPLIARLRSTTRLEPVTLADVPTRLTDVFKEKDGNSGRLVAVYPTLSTTSVNGKAQIEFARAIRDTAQAADPGAQVAGQVILTSDIIEMITEDGALAAMLSFFAVAALTFLVLRSFKDAGWVIGSLCLGTLWMGGAFGLLDLRFNFVNFAVLPITFGIGIDYAVNLYQRYRQTCSVEEALGASGGAVALCSTTTILGYAALLLADNMAIHSFGLTAVLGELTCLSAALFALPAFLAWRDQRRRIAAPEPLPASTGEQRATGT